MKIKLTIPLDIRQGTTYMRLTEKEHRPDIQDYLQGKRTNSDKLNDGIERYLNKLGLIEADGELSPEGEKVRDTGYYPTPSEGKYTIWYAEDPILNGKRIIYYEREATRSEDSIIHYQRLRVQSIERACCDKSDFVEAELNTKELSVVEHRIKGQEEICMIHQLEMEVGENHAVRFYLGTLKRGDQKSYILQRTHSANEDEMIWEEDLLPRMARQFSGEWRQKEQRIALDKETAETLGGSMAIKNFVLNIKENRFESIGFLDLENVMIMPLNERAAKEWFYHLLRLEIEQNYLQKSDLEILASVRNEKAFVPYRDCLVTPSVSELAGELKKNRTSYWHLMAPQDLNPHKETLYHDKAVSFIKGECRNMEEIIEKLGIQNVCWVAYYDKYVLRSWQQSYVGGLIQTIKAKSSLVITQKGKMERQNSGKNFIERHKRNTLLEIVDIDEVFENERGIHDRYLVVCDVKGKLKLWTSTNGLTTFDLDKKGNWDSFTSKTILTFSESITFTPVILETQEKLINYLKKHFYVK